MATVGAENHIAGAQVGTDTAGDSLLPHIGVAGPVDEALLMAAGQFLLGVAYNQHRPVQIHQPLSGSA